MSERSVGGRFGRAGRCLRPVVVAALLAAGPAAPARTDEARSWEPRVALGVALSPPGSVLVNAEPGRPWRALGERGEVHSRDRLLALPGVRGRLETAPRAVELTLWGNLPGLSDFPGRQTEIVLHDSRAFDLDLTLREGRVLLRNRKESGPARVWLRVEGAALQLGLRGPGDTVCLTLHSFWPRGVPYDPSPRPEHVPARVLTVLVVKGEADVKSGGTQHALAAPPGPASFHWDSTNGADLTPRNRRELPPWADPEARPPASGKPLLDAVETYLAEARDKEPRAALFDLLAAAGGERGPERARAEFAVYGLAALGDVERVVQALADARQAEARRFAVLALRHWIGGAAGRDQRLNQLLIDRMGYPKAQAATVLQLLHDALPADEPDTYEVLIAYLRHEKLAVRQLAWWQLSRLVPEELRVPYDPAAPDADRARAYAAWKERVPSGSLPSRKKKN